MSYTQSLGKVSIVGKGTWSNAVSYERLDVVKHNGGGYIAMQDVPAGTAITNTAYWMSIVDKGDTGNTGDAGNGISSITKVSTSGLVDTYLVLFTNGQTTTYTVTNGADGNDGDDGNGVESVELISTSELSKTYRMTFTDGTYFDYVVDDGETDISNAVRFDTAQSKTDAEKATAQSNIGITNVIDDVESAKDELYNSETVNGTGELFVNGVNIENVEFSGDATSATIRNPQLYQAVYNGGSNLYGMQITKNDDDSYTINGTATLSATFNLNKRTRTGTEDPIPLNGTYSLTVEVLGGTVENGESTIANDFGLLVKDGTNAGALLGVYYFISDDFPQIFTAEVSAENAIVVFHARNGKIYKNLRIRVMLNKGQPQKWVKYAEPVSVSLPSDNVVETANSFLPNVWIIANDENTDISVVARQSRLEKVETELDERISANETDISNIKFKSNFISANHRGYHDGYPENTIWALAQSKLRGFDWIETDVRFTSDGVGVLLHDETINRTARNADGTEITGDVAISSITYEQALEYDFGIYAGEKFAGTKIVTAEECIKFCKDVGLGILMELKAIGTGTHCANLVKQYAMENNVLWISFGAPILQEVNAVLPNAKIGLLTTAEPSTTFINTAIALKTNFNNVFVGFNYNYSISDVKSLMIENDIGYSVYTLDDVTALKTLDPYCFEITSNTLVANSYRAKNTIDKWTI